jgi:hypothetical protein
VVWHTFRGGRAETALLQKLGELIPKLQSRQGGSAAAAAGGSSNVAGGKGGKRDKRKGR